MASKLDPAFKVVEAGDSIQFKADGAAAWELNPPANAGVIGAASGVYVAPSLIPEPLTATVSAKDAGGRLIGDALLQLRPPDLKIVPASIELDACQAQHFTVEPNAYSSAVTWTLEPTSAGTLTNGVYTAPAHVWSRQEALVVASLGNLRTSAAVILSSQAFSRRLLVSYWVLAIVVLGTSLLCLWPKMGAGKGPSPSLLVAPPLVTIKSETTQQFHSLISGATNLAPAAVTWTASLGTISSNGLYRAPDTGVPASALITAASVQNPQLSARASVNISTGAQFSLQPDSIELAPGQSVQFNPRLTNGEGKAVTNLEAAGIRWSMNPQDAGTLRGDGYYAAPESIGPSRRVTVTARSETDPQLAASAVVSLSGPLPGGSGSLLVQLGLILTFGAIGSLIHAISSFVVFVGNRQFAPSWVLWYMFKPFQGAGLALAIYLVVGVGLLNMESTGGLMGASALAVMVGLFSEQASRKLSEVADTLFGSRVDKRGDKLDGTGQAAANAPHISSVTPGMIQNSPNLAPTLTIAGAQFVSGCVIQLNGADRAPASTTPTELKLNLKAEDVAKPGSLLIVVVNPNKQASNEAKVTIT